MSAHKAVMLEDVRTIALSLPDTAEGVSGHHGGASWRVHDKTFVWERGPTATDLRQLDARGRSWPEGTVIAARTAGPEAKHELLAAFPRVFFTIPHFDGYAAVLIPLAAIDRLQLEEVITDAWIARAPVRTAKAWLADHSDRGDR